MEKAVVNSEVIKVNISLTYSGTGDEHCQTLQFMTQSPSVSPALYILNERKYIRPIWLSHRELL